MMPYSNAYFSRKFLTLTFIFSFDLKDSMKPTTTNYTNIESSVLGVNPPWRSKISLRIEFYLLIKKTKCLLVSFLGKISYMNRFPLFPAHLSISLPISMQL